MRHTLDKSKFFALPTNLKRWTKDAKYCYSIGCQCNKCEIMELVEMTPEQCQMRYHVMELVRKLGKPEEMEEE